jgi:hypothetical protein
LICDVRFCKRSGLSSQKYEPFTIVIDGEVIARMVC